ncbi:MAG TPA: trypsin-like peptidase domain-containing protein [Candidatus Coprocola pullicola]|nr:trypsin-like peptidase domain-containing protein [Candidatus Coprocola pullicola]
MLDDENRTIDENMQKQEQPNIVQGHREEKHYYHEQVKKAEKKHRPWMKYIATCLIVSIAGGGSFGVGLGWSQNYFSKPLSSDASTAPVSTAPSATAVSSTTLSKKDVIKTVMPSVVSISTTIEAQSFFGRIEGSGAGSGVVFYEDDEKVGIVTNNHVIQGATEVSATFDSDKTVQATVVGTDREAEIAVLTVSKADLEKAGVKEITVAVFGDSDVVEVGDDVYAIGNALGEGLTATDGMISAIGKDVSVQGSELKDVLQTNAAINQGNSGGALVNAFGEVIGINTAKSTSGNGAEGVEGIGYAIPSNRVKELADILLTEGTVPKPGLGIYVQDLSGEMANLYRLPVGVLVRQVIPNASADQAGMQAGDIIIEVNGKKIMNTDDLSEALEKLDIGETTEVYVIRDGETSVKLDVVVGDMNEME